MGRRRVGGWVAVAVASLACATSAGAVRGEAQVTAVTLRVMGPASFSESCCTRFGGGSWLGPEYATADGTPSGVRARLDWSLTLALRAPAVDVAARKGLVQGWPVVEAGVVLVPHVVGGRPAGTIPASYLLTQKPGGAQTELSIALALHRTSFAQAHFVLGGTRSGTRTSTNAFSIGGLQAADWNRKAIEGTLAGLVLDGALPPAEVALRRTSRGFAGTVRDVNGGPVPGARVTLLHRAGSRWVAVGTSRTTAKGGFAVMTRLAPGIYRAATSVSGYTARSPARKA